MNTLTNNITRTAGIAFVAVALVVLPLSLAAFHAHADGFDTGFDTVDTSYPIDTGSSFDTVDTSYPLSTGLDTVDTSYPLSTSYDYGGYSLPYSSGYSMGGFSLPYSTGGSSNIYAPTTVSTYAPTNTNTCTAGNSCNTNIITDSHNIVTNPAPVINNVIASAPSAPSYSYSYPVYTPSCSTCSCYGNCYTPPVVPSYPNCYTCQTAYNYPPSVSLSAVPYTGLDLGLVGTALYWSFLVLWCLIAAYLIVYKRVQVSLVHWLNSTLFGAGVGATKVSHSHVSHTQAPVIKAEAKKEEKDAIDPFILSQIHR